MIDKSILDNIYNKATEGVEVINEAINWVNENEKDEKRLESLFQLKKDRRQIEKIENVVIKKPVIALFGRSQIGKSYMANNLLYDEDKKLDVFDHLNNKFIDYLAEINPTGEGTEASAAVTRFISEKESDPERFPVRIEIFKPLDILCIICDSYYNDYIENINSPLPGKDEIERVLEQLNDFKTKEAQYYLTDDDIYEIQEYFEFYSNFGANAFKADLQIKNYWSKVADNIPYINSNHWSKIFKLLWNFNSEYTEAFEISINFMKELNFESTLFVKYDELLRVNKDKDNRYIPIINVANFINFYDEAIKKSEIQTDDKKIYKVHNSRLGYLTQEIVLSVSERSIQNREFINNVDILDFPGARSRNEYKVLTRDNLLDNLKRGKIAYLFNKYSKNWKTNILLFCSNNSQSDVPELPGIIADWIKINIGANLSKRELNTKSKTPPLFVIFTWWNKLLAYEKGTTVIEDRVNNMFSTRLQEDLLKGADWIDKWMPNKNFDNFYFLRDFNYSKDIYKQNGDGKSLTELEFISDNQSIFFEEFKNKFISLHQDKRFLINPLKSFEEASLANKDGSEYIIENLKGIADNEYTVPTYLSVLNDTFNDVKDILNRKFNTDNKDQQIKNAIEMAGKLQFEMDTYFGKDAFYFGFFIEQLLVSESEIVSFYHELLQSDKLVKQKNTNEYILLRAKNPNLSPTLSFDENLEILRAAYHYTSKEQTQDEFEKKGIVLKELFEGDKNNLLNNSVILAEEAKNWFWETKLTIDNFTYFTNGKLDKLLLEDFLRILRESFTKVNLVSKIAEQIRYYVDVQKKIDNAEDMIAHLTAGLMNEFVNYLGTSFYTPTQINDIQKASVVNNLSFILPNEDFIFESIVRKSDNPDQLSIEKLLNYMDKLNENLSKKPFDLDTLKYVPMLRYYNQWSQLIKVAYLLTCEIPNYDPIENEKIGKIKEKFELIKFPELIIN